MSIKIKENLLLNNFFRVYFIIPIHKYFKCEIITRFKKVLLSCTGLKMYLLRFLFLRILLVLLKHMDMINAWSPIIKTSFPIFGNNEFEWGFRHITLLYPNWLHLILEIWRFFVAKFYDIQLSVAWRKFHYDTNI